MNTPFYVTTAIPYVNAAPHLGHALELVQADVLARHARSRSRPTRSLTGTDENAFKNVSAAAAAGTPTEEFVAANAAKFQALARPLALSFDDFIRTSTDPRHARAVAALWERSASRGDFYTQTYTGLYCLGCEQFYTSDELPEGLCAEHRTRPEEVSESNWFFALSRYAAPIREAIVSGRVRIHPESRRNEVLALLDAGLSDVSVSRPAARAPDWGIPVPGDSSQVIYVWWDALANYVSALGYPDPSPELARFWEDPAGSRVHLIGKGILRFHALHWLALLLSADLPLPTDIVVHDYLSIDGAKIAKSSGVVVSPEGLASRFGTDALRWWLLREPTYGADTDFTPERLVSRFNTELASGIGNLASRTLRLLHTARGGLPTPGEQPSPELAAVVAALPARVDEALARFDFRAATGALVDVVHHANSVLEQVRPWELARAEREGDLGHAARLDGCLTALLEVLAALARELTPFLPDLAGALAAALRSPGTTPPTPLAPRL